MSEGERLAFVENDVIGNTAIGTRILGSISNRKFKRKSKKSRRKSRGMRRRTTKRRKRISRVKTRVSRKKRKVSTKKGRKYPHWLKKYWYKKKRR